MMDDVTETLSFLIQKTGITKQAFSGGKEIEKFYVSLRDGIIRMYD